MTTAATPNTTSTVARVADGAAAAETFRLVGRM
jgi:hypothetical protein